MHCVLYPCTCLTITNIHAPLQGWKMEKELGGFRFLRVVVSQASQLCVIPPGPGSRGLVRAPVWSPTILPTMLPHHPCDCQVGCVWSYQVLLTIVPTTCLLPRGNHLVLTPPLFHAQNMTRLQNEMNDGTSEKRFLDRDAATIASSCKRGQFFCVLIATARFLCGHFGCGWNIPPPLSPQLGSWHDDWRSPYY